MFLLVLIGCTGAYDRFNKEGVDDEEGKRDAYFLRQHFVTMENWIIPIPAHANQMTEQLLGGSYGGYFGDTGPAFTNKNFATYAPESGWVAATFNNTMSNPITSYTTVQQMTDDPIFLSVSKILKVMALAKLTDIYGPIPYSGLEVQGQINVAYDAQDKVYELMIADINDAIDVLSLTPTANFSPLADRFYQGNVSKWIKLANSMKLRLAIRMANVNQTLAKLSAEQVASHSIGAFTTNDDNAILNISGLLNPYKVGMLDWNGGDSRIGADITSYMNGYNDPRMTSYFDATTISGYEDQYIGIRNGIVIPSPQTVGQSYSNINVKIRQGTSIPVMVAAEVAFLKAEGALRGWNMGGTAKSFYEQGVQLSFDQWGAGSASGYLTDNSNKPQLYVDPYGKFSFTGTPSSITIAWDNADASISGTNIERIITQKWIAIFPDGVEAWSEFRRTGYPKLMPVILNRSSVVSTERMARRLAYPQSEYTGNRENVLKAVQLLGGPDNMATDLWWAKKN